MAGTVKLGTKVKDVITGWEGIAWSRFAYLCGEDQIGVLGVSRDGNPGVLQYFEEERLVAQNVRELVELREGVQV